MTHRACSQPTAVRSDTAFHHHVTTFLSDLRQATTRQLIVQRIVASFIEVAQAPHGSLYLVEQVPTQFRHLHSQGPVLKPETPPTVSLSHAQIHALAHHDRIFYGSAFTARESFDSTDGLLSHDLSKSLIAPLVSMTTGELIAFVLLQSEMSITHVDPETSATLTTMAHIAATALDAVLLRDKLQYADALLHRTDRLRSLERIAASFTHAIRNPLTSIKTFLQLAPERAHDATFSRDFSQLALDDMNRIERLIQEMIDYAKPVKAHLTHEDLNEVLSSCLYFVALSTGCRRIKIEKDLAMDPPHGMVDRQQMKQALFNLLFKAIDALGKDGGTLRIRTTSSVTSDGTPCASIEIEEAREGLSTTNRIQAANSVCPVPLLINNTDEMELAIAHRIIHGHRGEIQVLKTEGNGMAFHVSLPLLAA